MSIETNDGTDQKKEPEKKPVRISPIIKKGFIETAHVDIEPLEPYSFEYRPPVSSEIETHSFNDRLCMTADAKVKEYARFFSEHVITITFQGMDPIPGKTAFPDLRAEAFNQIYAILNHASNQIESKIKN